jgi:hypothetical protein
MNTTRKQFILDIEQTIEPRLNVLASISLTQKDLHASEA